MAHNTGANPRSAYAFEEQKIRQALAALEAAYEAVFAVARPGMTAEEIDAIQASVLENYGGVLPRDRLHNTPCVIEEGGIPPKLRRDRVPLAAGKLWMMDNSIHVDGWWADLGRYAWFGSPPPDLLHAHQKILERQDEIAAAIRPGLSMDKIMASVPAGLGFEVHRIGREPGMRPYCGNLLPGVVREMEASIHQGLVFEPGQIICIELWAGLAGGIEDMYRVEEDGVVRVSALTRTIRALPV